MDCSILLPSRNEMWLRQTIDDALAHREAKTEIIAVLDGAWPVEPIPDHPDVHLVYVPESIGQRAATNLAARLSRAQYVMKLDAHCAVDQGFDRKLMAPYESGELGADATTIPAQYNLHVFDWVCQACGERTYQGPTPTKCSKCNGVDIKRDVVWRVRKNRRTEFWRFDNELHFQYWSEYSKRPDAQGTIADVMSSLGACFFMRRDRFFEIGGLDEAHGSWGQFGTEIACKSWLSGGRHVVNKGTWFAHLFRTQGGDFSFPYPQSGRQVQHARRYSRDLWKNGTWPKAVKPLSWLVEKFAPVPGWEQAEPAVTSYRPAVPAVSASAPSKGAIFYTDNRGDPVILEAVRQQLLRAKGDIPLVSVSLQPIADFGQNIVLPLERGRLTMFKQILAGLEAIDTDIVFFCEHDVLYHPSHFEFALPTKDAYYYNENVYKVDAGTGQGVFYWTKQTSGLCADRQLLLQHYRKRVERVERDGYDHAMGYEPGCHKPPRGVDEYPAVRWMSSVPNVDIRHGCNLTKTRWDPAEFRDKSTCQGWTLVDEVPGWGVVKGRFAEFLEGLR